MKRSEFLKLSCTGCMLGAAGLSGISVLLEGCSPKAGGALFKTAVADKQMTIPLAKLAAQKVTVVQGKGMEYNVAVHKTQDGKYEALLLRCTHFSNPLTVEGDSYSCPQHGSQFGINGEVKNGPASQPLKQLKCEVVNDNLVIKV